MVVDGRKISLKAFIAVLTLAFASLLVSPNASAEKYASLVMDADTKEVLHSRHADASRYPASLTKVMTLYMLFDALQAGELKLDEKLTVSRNAANQPPSNIKLNAGQQISVRDAIDALVVKSANDVAVVVAERLGGSESRFAALMTTKAKQMGMKNTRFRNASGLPNSRQRTTARDLSILAERMIEDHPAYYHYFQTKKFSWGGRTYTSHNRLLGTVNGVDGMKTGYIRASGFNLMTSAERDGRRIIVVMTGGRTAKSRNSHVKALVEAAFRAMDRSPETEMQVAALRKRHAFEAVITPTNPDDAAVPLLNGKPFSVAMGSADSEASTEEPDDSIELAATSPAAAERIVRAGSAVIPKSTQVVTRKINTLASAPQTSDRTAKQTKMKTEEAAPSVSAYEASQFGSVGGSQLTNTHR